MDNALRIAVVGAGPSGLYFAYLFKKSNPRSQVVVFEQNLPAETFAFGVRFDNLELKQLEVADAESHKAILEKMHRTQHQMIFHDGVGVLVDQVGYGGAISRRALLAILSALCKRVGVELRFGERVTTRVPWPEADLLVGADGASSAIRGRYSAIFGTSITMLFNRFAWYGTTAPFDMPAISFRSYNGGHFVAHIFPYSADMGTFVTECDRVTWDKLGLAALSDDGRRQLMETIFVEELQGHPLVTNGSMWRTFPVVANERWSAGACVLIGDALYSTHFSMSSGTQIAMEDSIALWKALFPDDSVASALERFRRERGPTRMKLLEAAKASYTWYEGFPESLDSLMPVELAYDYITRTGSADNSQISQEHPGFTREYAMWRRQQGYSGCC